MRPRNIVQDFEKKILRSENSVIIYSASTCFKPNSWRQPLTSTKILFCVQQLEDE